MTRSPAFTFGLVLVTFSVLHDHIFCFFFGIFPTFACLYYIFFFFYNFFFSKCAFTLLGHCPSSYSLLVWDLFQILWNVTLIAWHSLLKDPTEQFKGKEEMKSISWRLCFVKNLQKKNPFFFFFLSFFFLSFSLSVSLYLPFLISFFSSIFLLFS